MNEYQLNLQEEEGYLQKIVTFLSNQIEIKSKDLLERKSDLIEARKDMWENTVHFTRDFTRLTEINQYLSEVNIKAANYTKNSSELKRYVKVLPSPYFGRFDFIEEGYQDEEKIYIGLFSVSDPRTHEIYVYDWRAPISSIFYQYELGKAEFRAPNGNIEGDVTLKRQYKIQNGKLKYFFDCSIRINDEILQEVLSHNASPKMRNIVETIQKEQDLIIRDVDNDVLIVQGVAGSGKTSIALHRIAFLLYQGINSSLSSNNIIIISPNTIFSKYISNVLPELGEENVAQTTFDDIIASSFQNRFILKSRESHLEKVISLQDTKTDLLKKSAIAFKESDLFLKILNKFLLYYQRQILEFSDIYLDGKIIETRQQLKRRFLSNKVLPMAKQLKRIETMLVEKLHPLQRERLKKIEKIVQKSEGRDLEIKSFARLLSIKHSKALINQIKKFTNVDYFEVYKELFSKPKLFFHLAGTMALPEDIEDIIKLTNEDLKSGVINYEDYAALLYFKFKIEGSEMFTSIKQVVIDEAQDYSPLHFEVFKMLFPEAKYTILGDINQAVGKKADLTIYDSAVKILNKDNTRKLFLNTSYRSSYEISMFNAKILGIDRNNFAFERHEQEPKVIAKETQKEINISLIKEIETLKRSNYNSIAVICKTQYEANTLFQEIKNDVKVKLLQPNMADNLQKGVILTSSFMAKGLEFDAVVVYNANAENYHSDMDRKLLYVVCSRALHYLNIYYAGTKSPFLP